MSYYCIAVGGTGAKTIESLIHLCASGLMPDNEELYILSVDPDTGNGNLTRSSVVTNKYTALQDLMVGNTDLFKTKIIPAVPFTWSPTDKSQNLDTIFSYSHMKHTPAAKLYEVLYTKQERSTLLDEGFRGRPSIGAAVMTDKIKLDEEEREQNQHGIPEPWNFFQSRVAKDDQAKIFLTGSIFGGTGAAGIPTIANLLRQRFKTYCKSGNVRIGGGLVLPFFSFTRDESVDRSDLFATSEAFLTNTQAALKYYHLKNSFEDIYNAIYIIGDENLTPVNKFSIGAAEQENDAHIIDLYAAFAASDFFASRSEATTKQYMYTARKNANKIQWSDLPHPMARQKLGQFARFIFVYLHLFKPLISRIKTDKSMRYQAPWFIDYFSDINLHDHKIEHDMNAFDEYAISFVRWVCHIQGMGKGKSNGRQWELFHPQIISKVAPPEFEPAFFPEMIMTEGKKLSVNDIWNRVSSYEVKDPYARGFGRFLRALYDCCE